MVLEDLPELLEGVKNALTRDPRVSLVASCSNLQDAFATLRRGVVCEVALVDLGLPDGSGHSFLGALKDTLPNCAAVVWTQFDDDDSLFEALKQGATGYLIKTTPPAQIVSALLDAANGGAPMTPAIARRVLASFRPGSGTGQEAEVSAIEDLSDRERTVLRQLAQGYSYGEIAEQLGITLATVQTFIRRIYGKLDVHTKAEASRIAAKAGLL